MRRVQQWLLAAAAGVGFLVVAGAALWSASDWWLSGVLTVSLVAWLASVLAAIYSPAERRPAVLGAVVAAALYMVFALGPWFRGNVGPWLVTTQALSYAETKWLGRQPQQLATSAAWTAAPVTWPVWTTDLNVNANPFPYVISSSGGGTYVVNSSPVPVVQPDNFVTIGHWLCGWIAAAIGGAVCGWLARRKSPPAAATPKPENKP